MISQWRMAAISFVDRTRKNNNLIEWKAEMNTYDNLHTYEDFWSFEFVCVGLKEKFQARASLLLYPYRVSMQHFLKDLG